MQDHCQPSFEVEHQAAQRGRYIGPEKKRVEGTWLSSVDTALDSGF